MDDRLTRDVTLLNGSAAVSASSLTAAIERELETLQRANLRRTLRQTAAREGATIVVDGHAAVDFASNDYLGLASDPRLAAAASAAFSTHGVGAAAARLISGNHPAHTALERALAEYKGTEASLLFSSGYMANIGTIPALVGKRDVVYTDALNHASLIDAARLSRAEVRVFPHCDLGALRAMLASDRGTFRRRMVVVDGVFSMDGDLFPLDALVPLAREFDAWTYVDDAHGTAVIGATGRGVVEQCGVDGEIDIVMGTLDKAIGTAGAFVAGSATLIEFLVHRARAFVFTTGSPPALAEATREALRIIHEEPWRRERLHANARRLRSGLAARGYVATGEPTAYIIPVIIGASDATMRIGTALREAGYIVGAVRPPTVPMGTSRLRITVSAAHTDAQIDGLLDVLDRALREVVLHDGSPTGSPNGSPILHG